MTLGDLHCNVGPNTAEASVMWTGKGVAELAHGVGILPHPVYVWAARLLAEQECAFTMRLASSKVEESFLGEEPRDRPDVAMHTTGSFVVMREYAGDSMT